MIDFPYTVDDEPTEDWKVEQVLHWWLLRANTESEAECDRIVEGLSKQLDDGKKELWEAHKQVSEIIGDNDSNGNENIENVENHNSRNCIQNQKPSSSDIEKKNSKRQIKDKPDAKPVPAIVVPVASSRPTRNRKAPATETTDTSISASAPATNNKKPDTIHIDIVGGPYQGTFYDLQPKSRCHAWIGRSSSAKFKDRGISLPQDLEVSTSHGRFELKGGKFYFTDVASTNGTRINGEGCEPNVPYELPTTGMTILAGQTIMKVTLLRLA
mmetsp:Transcript_8760/g.18919  ORF Transcript_8760/g.18919 Transcript_8760/m.18919 type:complete len:270 (-) Transcript_8760:216-1025(-)